MGMHSTFELCESSRTESFMCIAIAFPRPRCTRKGRFYGWLVNRSQPTLKLSAIWFSFCKKKTLNNKHVRNALKLSFFSIPHPLKYPKQPAFYLPSLLCEIYYSVSVFFCVCLCECA